VVERCRGILPETARGEIDRGGEGGAGAELRVLLVRPLELEARRIHVVGIARFADDGFGIPPRHPPAVFVALYVTAFRRHFPRAVGVDAAQECQVHVVVRGPVETAVAQEEAARGLFAVTRYDDARTAPLREREESFRNRDG